MNSSFTAAAVAALLLASAPVLAGGMPSDEGPELLLEDGEEMFTPEDTSSLDSELPDYAEIDLAALEITAIELPPANDSAPAWNTARPRNRLQNPGVAPVSR